MRRHTPRVAAGVVERRDALAQTLYADGHTIRCEGCNASIRLADTANVWVSVWDGQSEYCDA